jgi:hypothetical protein
MLGPAVSVSAKEDTIITLALDRGIPRDARGARTAKRLLSVANLMNKNANPDESFFYLGGPMTGIPQFNFPEFHRIGAALRERGYNIVSPAELDDPETEAAAMASPDGAPGSGSANGEAYEDFLGRDLIICSIPTCVGMICLPGWHNSRGARGESWVCAYLKKPIYEYSENNEQGAPWLIAVERDERLAELGVPDFAAGAVPRDKPGVLTVGTTTTEPGRPPRPLEAADIEEAVKKIEEVEDPPHERYYRRREALSLDTLGPI